MIRKKAISKNKLLLMIAGIILVIACIAGYLIFAGMRDQSEAATEDELREKMADASVTKIAVKGDLVLKAPLEVKGTKILYGDGSITAGGDGWAGDEYMIVIPSGAQLTVKDAVTIDADGVAGGIHAAEGAVWSIEQTASVKNASAGAANTLVEGVFHMNGGTMSGAMGHNVYNKGEMTLSEGEIAGSGEKYAGIYSEGTLTQNGGTVRDAYHNVTVISGEFSFNGGNNQKSVRDGIYVAEGAKLFVTAKSATVTGSGVRGIYLCGEATVDGITLNNSGDTLLKVSKTGTLNLHGGALADSGYHSIENAGKLVMTGGSVSNSYNCGIVNTGELEITGGSFLDNVKNKAVLNKHNGTALISGQKVMFSGNRFAIANEDTASLELTGAEVLLTTVTNVYAYDGKVNIHDISLGASGSNNVRIYKAEVTMNNVQVLGNSSAGSASTHGILLEGGKLEAADVTVKNATGYGIRNKGGAVTAENLVISKSTKAGGINNTLQDHTGVPGVMEVKNLTVENIRYNNIVVDGGSLSITDGQLLESGTNNTKITAGTLTLKNVDILGNLADTDGRNHAVYATGGTIEAENVKISNGKFSGLRVDGDTAVISGSKVTISDCGEYAIDQSRGQISFDGLTTENNHYNIGNHGGTIKLRNSTMGATVSNNVRVNGGEVDLQNVVVNGHTEDHVSDVHALFVSGGTLTGGNITVQNVSNAGLRVKTGTANIQGLTVNDAGADGVWISEGNAAISNLVIKKAKSAGVSATGTGNITVNGGSISNTTSHGAKSENSAKLTLQNISVAISLTKDRHGVLAQGGDVHLENVKITGHTANTDGAGIRINKATSHVSGKGVQITGVPVAIKAEAGTSDLSNVRTENITNQTVLATHTANLVLSDSEFGISGTNSVKVELKGTITLKDSTVLGTKTNHGIIVENDGRIYGENLTVKDTKGSAVRVVCSADGSHVEIDGLITENIGEQNIYINSKENAGNVGSIVIKNGDLGLTAKHSVQADAGELTLQNTKIRGHKSGTADNIHTIFVCQKAPKVKLEKVTVLNAAGDALRIAAGEVAATDFTSEQTGRYGIWADGGKLTAQNTTLSNSRIGVYVTGGTMVLSGAHISGCANSIHASNVELTVNGYADGNLSQIGTSTEDNIRATGTGVVRLNDVNVLASAKNNVVAIDGGTVYMTDSAVTGGNHSVLADKNGKVYLQNVSIGASLSSGIRANTEGSVVDAADVVIDGAKTGLNIKCGTVQIRNITVRNTKEAGVDLRQADAVANVTLSNLITENCGTHAIYTSGADAKLTVNGAKLANDGSDHVINLNGGPMTLNDVTVNAAAGQRELYSGAGWLTIGGEMDMEIYIATAPGRVIKVNKALTGDQLVVDWKNAPTGNAIEFTDEAMLNASKDRITLGSVQGANKVLSFAGKAATLEEVETYIAVTSWSELCAKVSAMTADSFAEYRVEGNADDWKADTSLTVPEGVKVKVSADSDAPGILVASGVSPFTFEGNTELTLENLTVGGTSAAKAAHIIVPKTATLTLKNTTLQYFEGQRGGAVHVNCGTLIAVGSTFANNSNATNWGGAIGIWGGSAAISDSRFAGNTAKFSGGAIINYMADSGSFGGTKDNSVGKLELTNCVFTGNTTQEHGGAVASWSGGTTTITGCVFGDEQDASKGNSVTKNGGAIHVQDDHKMTVTGSKFFHNSTATNANNLGGAIYAKSSVPVQVSGCTFQKNSSKFGGAINVETKAGGGMSLDQCVFRDNKAQISGGEAGALRIAEQTSVTNCSFEGNAATGNGGAVLVLATAQIRDTVFIGNSGGQGGAVSVATGKSLTLHNIQCTNNKTTQVNAVQTTNGYGDIRIADSRNGGEVKISGKIVATIWNNQAHSVTVDGALTADSAVIIDWRLDKCGEMAGKTGIVFGSQAVMNASRGYIELGVDAAKTLKLQYSTAAPWQATLVKEQ